MWAHRLDAIEGVEGWIDADAARAWARAAASHFNASREASSLADSKAHLRSALEALDAATAALNLPQSQGSGDVLTRAFPFGIDRVELDASPEAKAAAQRAAVREFGSLEGARDWALAQPLGRYQRAGFAVRVFDGLDGERAWSLEAPDADVLSWRRAQPATTLEQRASEIVRDPWAAYVARRKEIDATNARYAGYWGLTTPEQIAGFQVAADAVNATLGAEWEARQRARVQANANEILDTISQYAAATVIGAPIAAVMQAFKLLTGILPWVTEAPPPPALARARSGGLSDKPVDRPTHRVPVAPAEPLEAVSTMSETAAEYRGPAPGATRAPGLSSLLGSGARSSLLGAAPAPVGRDLTETSTGVGRIESSAAPAPASALSAPARSGASSSSSTTAVVVVAVGAAGLLYLLTR